MSAQSWYPNGLMGLGGEGGTIEYHVHDASDITTGTKTSAFISDFATAVDTRITAQKGAVSGIASLDGTGKVPAAQLPAYVDDALEYATLAAFPATGTAGIIYVALNTGFTYRWSGTAYTRINTGDVASVFGRTGAIVATSGDYTTAQVTESTNKKYVTDAQLATINATTGTNTGDQTNITGNAGTVTTINGKISNGTGISLSGLGTAASPYVITSTGGGASYQLTTMSTSGTGSANTAAFISDIESAASAGNLLFIPAGTYNIASTAIANLTANQRSVIRGDGNASRLAVQTGSDNIPIRLSTLGEHDAGTPNELTVTAVTAVNNLLSGDTTGLNYSTTDVYKITVSSGTASTVQEGQMVSLVADALLQYGDTSWTDSDGDAQPDEFNWQHEMARVLLIIGDDIYLDRKLHYSATSYNSANYKRLKYYPMGTEVDWSGFVFTVDGDEEDVRESTASRPNCAVEFLGIDNIKFEVDFPLAWEGTASFTNTIEPKFESHVGYIPNGFNNAGSSGVALGYHPRIDGALSGGDFISTGNHGVRHAATTTWLEEARWSITNTGYSAGATTTIGFSTSGNAPTVGDRVYVNMSGVSGTINTMPVGTYLITAKTSTTITVDYNSTGLSFTSGTGWGVLFQVTDTYRYGSVVGARIDARVNNSMGALLDPHENAIDITYSGSVESSNGYKWGATVGRIANTRGIRDTYKNIRQKGCASFIETDAFSRQFGVDNINVFDNILLHNQANCESSAATYFNIKGSSSVTDRREIIANNVTVTGRAGNFLQYKENSADRVLFTNLKYHGDTFLKAAIPANNMMTVSYGYLKFSDSTFDFSNTTSSDYIRFMKMDTGASTVIFENCKFINVPSPTTAPSAYFFDITVTGCTLSFINCDISFTGSGTGLLWLRVGTGFTANITYDGCNFTGISKLSTSIGLAYGNGSGSVVNVVERNCVYDATRYFVSNASASLCVASDNDVKTTAVSTTAVTTEETLMSRVFPANTFNSSGKKVKFTVWGVTANNANVKTLRIKFGSTTIMTRTLTTGAANTWSVEGYVVTTGTNTQVYVISQAFDGATAITPVRGSLTETASAAITFAVTGQNGTASASDITCSGLILEVTP